MLAGLSTTRVAVQCTRGEVPPSVQHALAVQRAQGRFATYHQPDISGGPRPAPCPDPAPAVLQNVSNEAQKTAESIAGAAPEIADKVSNRITKEADQVTGVGQMHLPFSRIVGIWLKQRCLFAVANVLMFIRGRVAQLACSMCCKQSAVSRRLEAQMTCAACSTVV